MRRPGSEDPHRRERKFSVNSFPLNSPNLPLLGAEGTNQDNGNSNTDLYISLFWMTDFFNLFYHCSLQEIWFKIFERGKTKEIWFKKFERGKTKEMKYKVGNLPEGIPSYMLYLERKVPSYMLYLEGKVVIVFQNFAFGHM